LSAGTPPRAAALAALLLLLLTAAAGPALAQRGGWTEPELVYETVDSIDAPHLVSDPAGVTHLVWRETNRDTSTSTGEMEAIFYTNDLDGRLGQGRDIMAMSALIGPIVAGDANSLVHLIFRGPNNILYHSLSAAEDARSAQGWVQPVAIAAGNPNAHITVDGEGVAHVVFPGMETTGVYYIRYDAANDAWTSPESVSLTAGSDVSADFARLAIAPDGTLHVVWTEYLLPQGWPPTGIYYANSTDGGATWSRATELAGADNVQANIAVDSRGRVHVAWNRAVGVGGRYHQWSGDGGLTWSPLAEVAPAGEGGTEGPPQLVIDSADAVHILMTYSGCAQYARWVDGVWSAPECISGRRVTTGNGYIEQPALSIANGNQLHAVFWVDRSTLWHATMTADAPFVPPIERVEAVPAAVAAATESPGATATPALSPEFDLSSAPPPAGGLLSSPARALLPAAAAAGALLGLVLLVKLVRSR
jgi:hypothetical protein